ncbi:MAG: recombinase family protein [Candidatus Cloacimonetes bacterium]|nr:recombinase family protein [Candidatus Cloacimonadota bacterium]
MNAIYGRQSVDKKDSISIDSQIEFCKKEIGDEPFKIYTDRGYSGKNTDRPEFKQLIKDIESGLINKVVVYRLDRISRSVLDFSKMIDVFEKNNVGFVSTTEKFDTKTPIGRAMLSIIIIFAQLERETIQQRITDNYYARGRRGFFMGGNAPYAFNVEKILVDNKKVSIYKENIDQVEHLKYMFHTYAYTDTSLGRIIAYLNENGIKTKSGTVWDNAKLSSILKNPSFVKADPDIYTYYKNKNCIINNEISDFIGENGCFLFGKRPSNERKYTNVENHTLSIGLHKGIIDSHTFLLCQYKMDNNKQLKNTGKGKNSWLSGVIKCGYCHYSMSALIDKRYNNKYFICRKKSINVCRGHNEVIYMDKVENSIEKRIFKKVKELNAKNININKNNSVDTKINKIKIQIAEIDKQIENMINQLVNANEVVTKYMNNKITELDKEKQELIKQVEKEQVKNIKQIPINNIYAQINNWDNLDLEKKKLICKFLINKVFIFDNDIEIDWNVDEEEMNEDV